MPDFDVSYPSGFTVYGLVTDGANRAWNGSAFVDPTGIRPTCAVAMTYDAASGTYQGSMPAGLPSGTFVVDSYLQLGASPADGDPLNGTGPLAWPGSGSSAPASAASFETALVADLKADSVIAAIAGARVYPRKVPQAAPGGGASLPALVYLVGKKSHERNLDGPCGIARCRVLIHSMSRSDADAKALAEQLRLKYDGLRGLLGAVEVVETWLDDDPDDYEEPLDGSDAGVYSVPAAFVFRYRETVPSR